MELETGRTMDSSTSFAVGERVFHVVTEALTVRSTTGRILSVFVSPITLLVVEPHDRYVVSLTDDDLTVDELLTRVPVLKGKIPSPHKQ